MAAYDAVDVPQEMTQAEADNATAVRFANSTFLTMFLNDTFTCHSYFEVADKVQADADAIAFLQEEGVFELVKDSPVAVKKAKTADDCTFSEVCLLAPKASEEDEDEDEATFWRQEFEAAGLWEKEGDVPPATPALDVPPSPLCTLKRTHSEVECSFKSYTSDEFFEMFGTPKNTPYTPKRGKI